jgi:alpha-tubulin suppressor-like RCC1 family protein
MAVHVKHDRVVAVLAAIGLIATMAVLAVVGAPAPAGADPVATSSTALAAGGSHSCAVTAVGGVKCWGANSSGQLGDGNTTFSTVPVDVVGLSGVVAVAAGGSHSCALTGAGGIKCWGLNTSYQLGDGTNVNSSTPIDVSGLTSGVASISAGATSTCAVTSSGGAKCWGANTEGQIGNGTLVTAQTPSDVSGLTSGVASVEPGDTHTCAVTTGGAAKCWGLNSNGQLGNNSTTRSTVPVDVSGLSSGAASIDPSGAHTCALSTAGAASCWGINTYGELGTGATSRVPLPVTGMGSDVAAIRSGANHTCALRTDGDTYCWGLNSTRQLGDGTTTNRATAVQAIAAPSGTTGLSGSGSHVCALSAAGQVKCWGSDGSGQLGNGTVTASRVPVPSTLTSGITSIVSGSEHNCALTDAGGVKCWGENGRYQLGNGAAPSLAPNVDVTGLTSGVTKIAAGAFHTCALTSGGGVKCWGWGASGQLGDGTMTWRSTPVDVTGLTSGVIDIAAGRGTTCAVTGAGGVKCWGDGTNGQLGNGTSTSSLTPVDVTGLTSGVSSVGMGSIHSCAITTSGAAKCWGNNSTGQLGNSTNTSSNVPVNVTGLSSGVTAIAGGRTDVYYRPASGANVFGSTCALVSGGVKCWGSNGFGQLGNGTTNTSTNVPTDVTGLTSGMATISVGYVHACATTTSGAAYCWGDNGGALGNGLTADSSVPVPVTGMGSGASSVSAGGKGTSLLFGLFSTSGHGCALTDAGAVLCWVDYLSTATDEPVTGGEIFYSSVPDAPTITGDRSPSANAQGWNDGPVTVSFECASDDLVSCTEPVVVSTDGADQSVTGTATDSYGQSASATVSGINIDQVAPTLSATVTPEPDGDGWRTAPVTVSWTCGDALSGIEPGACPADEVISDHGVHTVSGSVVDRAGNLTEDEVEVRVDDGSFGPPSRDAVTAQVADVRVDEGEVAQFEVTRAGSTAEAASVTVKTVAGTATSDADYTAVAPTVVTFAPGESVRTVDVSTLDEGVGEHDEVFTVTLTAPVNLAVSDSTATGTISDPGSDAPTLSVRDVAVDEGDPATVEIVRSGDTSEAATVRYQTANSSAVAPADFTAIPATTVTFAPGETTEEVVVATNDDAVDVAANKAFTLTLAAPVNATIADSSGAVTILDDEGTPVPVRPNRVSVADVRVVEGGVADVTVRRRGDLGLTSTVKVASTNGTAFAGTGQDYVARTLTVLTFAPGQDTVTVPVTIHQDTSAEPAETLTITVSAPSSDVTIEDTKATVTINDDDNGPGADAAPQLRVGDVRVVEGRTAVVTVTRTGDTSQSANVKARTNDATATAADYTAVATTTIHFAVGESTVTIPVATIDDEAAEHDETFTVSLSAAVGSPAVITDATGTITIVDLDGQPPTFEIGNLAVDEGSTATFTIRRTGDTSQTAAVTYATSNGTAIAGTDFTAVPATRTTFAPGQTTKTVTVATTDNGTDAPTNRTFTLKLSLPTDATLADTVATATIRDDEGSETIRDTYLSAGDVRVREGGTATLTITRRGNLTGTTTVKVATANATATAGDFTAVALTTITFAPGETTRTITIATTGDTTAERNETFTANLSGAGTAVIDDAQALLTIVDDD